MMRKYLLAGLAPMLVLAIFGCIGGSSDSTKLESFKTPSWKQGDYWVLQDGSDPSLYSLWYVNGTQLVEVNGQNISSWVVLRISQTDNESIDIFYFDKKEYTLIQYEEYRRNVTSSSTLLTRKIQFESGLPVFGLSDWKFDMLYNEPIQYFYHYYEYYEGYSEKTSFLIISFSSIETVDYNGKEHRILKYSLMEELTANYITFEYDLEEGFFWYIDESASILNYIFEDTGRFKKSGNAATVQELMKDTNGNGIYDVIEEIGLNILLVSWVDAGLTYDLKIYNTSQQLYINGSLEVNIDGTYGFLGTNKNITNASIYLEVYSYSKDLFDTRGDGRKLVGTAVISSPAWVHTATGSQANMTQVALNMRDSWSISEGSSTLKIRAYVIENGNLRGQPSDEWESLPIP